MSGIATISGDVVASVGDFNKDGAVDIVGFSSGPHSRIYSTGVASTTTSVTRFDLNDKQSALQAIDTIEGYMNRVAAERGTIGSALSRVNSALATTRSNVDNLETARSRIVDVDVATETAALLRQQILQLASTAVLSQINQNRALVLTLLSVKETSSN